MINVNVGVLGHVDSGKTSLCRCLSEVLSTCALDKHKQSQERKITIDLGFSSFYIKKKIINHNEQANINVNLKFDKTADILSDDIKFKKEKEQEKKETIDCKKVNNIKEEKKETNEKIENIINSLDYSSYSINTKNGKDILNIQEEQKYEVIQVCLVDCPGHQSLLKCIIMGAEITDLIFLVIDINKGIQKQTIECLVLCEIVNSDIIIILNKIDLIPINEREKKIIDMKKKIIQALDKTRLRKLKYYIIGLCADAKRVSTEKDDTTTCVTDAEKGSNDKSVEQKKNLNIDGLINLLTTIIKIPERKKKLTMEEFYFWFDHNFEIKSKGIAYTGTVIKGIIKINCNVIILPLNIKGKIKDIQSFKKKKEEGYEGDRLSLLISHDNLKNLKKVERGIIVHEHTKIHYFSMFICKVNLVEFYKKNINSSELLTCIIGFSSSPCYGYFFKKIKSINNSACTPINGSDDINVAGFDRNGNYLFIEELDNNFNDTNNGSSDDINNAVNSGTSNYDEIYFLVILKKKIYSISNEKCIFLKNDENINCRICLHGIIVDIINDNKKNYNQQHKKNNDNNTFIVNMKPSLKCYEGFENFKIMKESDKIGHIERVVDNYTLLCKNMFTCSNQVNSYVNKKIYLADADYLQNKTNFKINQVGCIIKPFAKNGKFIVQFDEDISYIKKENFKSFILLIKYYKDIFTKQKIFLFSN
ncbi:selenocysteine-specific elongation factor selB homologue, putative [Hepatocystis sp. ex Piliocolobus tephrosceles]|nr:selenocysteine-specific elongation factor selB homologue, putative [Hepatocystis sp. ex Piliocolobus tephrosceles]